MRYSVLFSLHSRKTSSGRQRKTDQEFLKSYEMMIKTSRGERSMVQDAVDQQLCVKVNSAAPHCVVSWWDGADTGETPGNSMNSRGRTDLRERRKTRTKQNRTKKMAPLNPAQLNQFVWVEANWQPQSHRCDWYYYVIKITAHQFLNHSFHSMWGVFCHLYYIFMLHAFSWWCVKRKSHRFPGILLPR